MGKTASIILLLVTLPVALFTVFIVTIFRTVTPARIILVIACTAVHNLAFGLVGRTYNRKADLIATWIFVILYNATFFGLRAAPWLLHLGEKPEAQRFAMMRSPEFLLIIAAFMAWGTLLYAWGITIKRKWETAQS